jgi:hypothetical protein
MTMPHVIKTTFYHCPGGRQGTALCALDFLVDHFGEPNVSHGAYRDYGQDPVEGYFDSKITRRWIFDTPRGLAEVRDYWWNAEYEWSIAAEDRRAAMWLARELRRKGCMATTRAKQDMLPAAIAMMLAA